MRKSDVFWLFIGSGMLLLMAILIQAHFVARADLPLLRQKGEVVKNLGLPTCASPPRPGIPGTSPNPIGTPRSLLSLLGCMARPTADRIVLEGREITSLPEGSSPTSGGRPLGLSSSNLISSTASASSRT